MKIDLNILNSYSQHVTMLIKMVLQLTTITIIIMVIITTTISIMIIMVLAQVGELGQQQAAEKQRGRLFVQLATLSSSSSISLRILFSSLDHPYHWGRVHELTICCLSVCLFYKIKSTTLSQLGSPLIFAVPKIPKNMK